MQERAKQPKHVMQKLMRAIINSICRQALRQIGTPGEATERTHGRGWRPRRLRHAAAAAQCAAARSHSPAAAGHSSAPKQATGARRRQRRQPRGPAARSRHCWPGDCHYVGAAPLSRLAPPHQSLSILFMLYCDLREYGVQQHKGDEGRRPKSPGRKCMSLLRGRLICSLQRRQTRVKEA